MGAAIASFIAELTVLVLSCIFAREYLRFSRISVYFKRYMVAGAIMLATIVFIKKQFETLISSVVLTFVLIVVGMVTYSLMLFFARDTYIINTMNKIIKNKT